MSASPRTDSVFMPLTDVRGTMRCSPCVRAIWATGQPVDGCRVEGCGRLIPSAEPSAATERDEAIEVLRDLLHTMSKVDEAMVNSVDDALLKAAEEAFSAASHRAGRIVEGVERTHILVPNEHALNAAYGLRKLAERGDFNIAEQRVLVLAEALEAHARGEHVEWPATDTQEGR